MRQNKKEFILVFDLPGNESAFRRKINRLLSSKEVEQIQKSVWKSKNLNFLMDIGIMIRNEGGNARILEEKFVF